LLNSAPHTPLDVPLYHSMTHIKRQKLISSTLGAVNIIKTVYYINGSELMKLFFAVLDVSLSVDLTRCYETEGFFTFILRKKGDCFKNEIIHGTTPGSHTRGRSSTTWIDNIKSWSRLFLAALVRNVEKDRHQWEKIVHDAINPLSEDG